MQEQVQDTTTKVDTTQTKICLICHKPVNGSLTKCPDDNGDLINTKQDKLIGEIFANRYKMLSVVGQGGMSTVYKAQHTYMDRVVAVKLLHSHLVSDPISVQRFQQEAKAAASLTHPNVITVYDFGVTEEGLAFLVMDYLEGPSLGDLLDRSGPVPADEALDIFRQVLKGLCHAHRKGVVHRDLKPRNLVLAVDEDGTVQVKIVDFGIAKVIPQDGGESQHLTQTGEVFGSPIYMSPEQCSGQPLDVRSDVYSLGCVMFEVLTGVPPFLGKNAVETMSMHVNDDPPDFKQIAPNVVIPEELQEVVFGCLKKDQKKRFQSAAAVLEALPLPLGMTRASQASTVAIRLGDMLQSSTTAGSAQSRSKSPRKSTRRHLKISSKTLATVFGVAFFSLFFLIAFNPFVTDEEPGSPMQKMWWQFEMWASDRMMEHQWPGVAINILNCAVDDAKRLRNPRSKKLNYDAVILALGKLSDAYIATGNSAGQEDTVAEIVRLDRERYEVLGKQILDDILASQKYLDEIARKGDSYQKHSSESRLNWAGSVRRIVEVARRLEASYAFGLEYELLDQSIKLLTRLYGEEFIGLADIYAQMADCLLNQDRLDEIRDRKFFEKIRDLRYQHVKLSGRKPEDDPEYIRAELHLGQWQRDRGEFVQAESLLRTALAHAQACQKITSDQLAEYYGSLADLLRQRNKLQEAQVYENKAMDERLNARDKCRNDLKAHDYTTRH